MTSAVTYAERARRSALLASSAASPVPAVAAPTHSSSSSDNWRLPTAESAPTVEAVLEKAPAPVPKLNVWSIRKEQLAAAVVPSPAPLPTPRSSTKSATSRPSSKPTLSAHDPKLTPNPSLPKSSSNSPATTPPPPSDLPTITKRIPEGWTGIAAASTLSAPDRESWPSPIEEIKKGKLKPHTPPEEVLDDVVPKKKADKTKWIPIEADITVNGTSTAPRFAASSSSSTPNDKRTKRTTNNAESSTNRSRRNSTATEGKSSKSTSGNKSKNSASSYAALNAGENASGGERRTGGSKGNPTTNGEGGRKSNRENAAGLPSKPIGSSTAKSSGQRNGGATKLTTTTTTTGGTGTTNLANLVAALPITVSNEVAELVSNEMAASTPVDVVSPSSTAIPTATTTTTPAAAKERNDVPLQSISSANSTTSFSSSQPHQQYPTDLSSFAPSSASGNNPTSNPNPNYRTQAPLRSTGPQIGSGSHRGGSSNSRGGGGGGGGSGRGGMRNNGNYLPRIGGGGPASYGVGNGFEYDPNIAPFGFVDPNTFYPSASFPQPSPGYPSSTPYPVDRFPVLLPHQSLSPSQSVGIANGGVGMMGGGAGMIGGVPILDPYSLDPTRYWLLGQIEYYFSYENLCRDMFLRSKMDDAGWLPISLISSFNRIKNLSTDLSIISETMSLTPLLEMNGNFVRLRGNWGDWLLPGASKSTVIIAPPSSAAVTLPLGGGEEKNGGDGSTNGSSNRIDNHTIIPLKIGSPKSPARQLNTEIDVDASRNGIDVDGDVEVLEGFGTGNGNGIGEERSAVAGMAEVEKVEEVHRTEA